MKSCNVNVFLPKFTFSNSMSLKNQLMSLGMVDAFQDMNADFSGLSVKNDIKIDDVIHQAFVEVNFIFQESPLFQYN